VPTQAPTQAATKKRSPANSSYDYEDDHNETETEDAEEEGSRRRRQRRRGVQQQHPDVHPCNSRGEGEGCEINYEEPDLDAGKPDEFDDDSNDLQAPPGTDQEGDDFPPLFPPATPTPSDDDDKDDLEGLEDDSDYHQQILG
jgi:hypothetical protein